MSAPLPPSALTAERRAADLARLVDGWRPDVLVVGAGFTGAGIALDAATRGLEVAVVDRGDLANGTSRWSSKLATAAFGTSPRATSGWPTSPPSNAGG